MGRGEQMRAEFIRMAGLVLFTAWATADTVYEVGAGKTYATINAAMAKIKTDNSATMFNSNVIVRVFGSHTNNYWSTPNLTHQPKPTGRLIVEANPGDTPVITGGNNKIDDDYVVIRGFRWIYGGTFPTSTYILVGDARASHSLVLHNNEFYAIGAALYAEGGPGLNESGAFQVAVVNNFFRDIALGTTMFTLDGTIPILIAGNIVEDRNQTGTDFTINGETVFSNIWVVHNTWKNFGTGVYPSTLLSDMRNIVIANNILIDANEYTYRFAAGTGAIKYPQFARNLADPKPGKWWARTGAGDFTTLAAFNTFLTNNGYDPESGSIDSQDPQFVDAAGADYRVNGATEPYSPAVDAATAIDYFQQAADALGISALLQEYNNPALDRHYQRLGVADFSEIGACTATEPPPPAGTVISLR